MRLGSISFIVTLTAAGFLLGTASFSAQAASIITPGDAAGTEAPGNNVIPFSYTTLVARYQQSAAASEFSSFSGPMDITSIAFRRDGTIGPSPAFSFTWSDVSLGLSTIQSPLTTSLDSNRGADFETVYSGPLTVSLPATSGSGPNPFDFVITFQTPFLYKPAQGDLVWEWQNFGGENPQASLILDYEVTPLLTRASTYGGGAPATESFGFISNSGLVTEFGVAAVPEPSSWVMLLIGFFGAGAIIRRRRTAAVAWA